MSNSFYGSQRGRVKVAPQNKGSDLSMPSPIDPDKKITWKRRTIQSSEIWKQCAPSEHNPRKSQFLHESTLGDLLSELQVTKTNSDLARAYEADDGKLHILSGLRRATALSLIDDGALQIEYSGNLSIEEQKHFARISEGQRKLSSYEQVLMLAEEEIKLGRKMSVKEAAEFLKESSSKISVIRKYMRVPTEIYEHLSHPDYLSFDGVKVITDAMKNHGAELTLSKIKAAEFDSITSSDYSTDIESYKRHVTGRLKDILAKAPRLSRAPDLSAVWGSAPKSVTAKRTTRGELSIKIGKSSISEALEQEIVSVLSKHLN